MIVTVEIPAATRRKIERDAKLAARAGEAFGAGMEAAVAVGAEEIREKLSAGELGLRMQHPGTGLAASVIGWMLDRSAPEGAIGVPANSPAAAYAGILQRGGTIRPKTARALAVPISDEAKRYTSPRDMADLTLIPRKGKPPLLVRMLAARGGRRANWQLHWVLLSSVYIRPRHWLTKGAERAAPQIAAAFGGRIGQYLRRW